MLVLVCTVVLVTIVAKSVIKYIFENKMLTFHNGITVDQTVFEQQHAALGAAGL